MPSFLPDPIAEMGERVFPMPPRALQSQDIISALPAAVQHVANMLPHACLTGEQTLGGFHPEPGGGGQFGHPSPL